MENEYDALIRQAPADPGLRDSLSVAALRQPDTEAKLLDLSQRTGIPLEAVRRTAPRVQQHAARLAIDAEQLQRDAPELAKWLTDPINAGVAHDDVGALSTLGRWIKGIGWNIGTGATAGTGANLMDTLSAAADLDSRIFGTVLGENNIYDTIATGLRSRAARARESISQLGPQPHSDTEQAVYSGAQSLGQAAALLPLGVAAATRMGAARAVTGTMSSMVAGQAYGEARREGLEAAPALRHGLEHGAIEYVTEMFSAGPLLKLFGGVTLKKAAEFTIKEVAGEQAATALQDMADWLNLHPEKSAADYMQARGPAAYQTFVATLTMAGIQGGAVRTAGAIANRLYKPVDEQNQAKEFSNWMQRAIQHANASKLKARAPQTFADFVDRAGGEGTSVFVNADILAQSARQMTPEEFEKALPGVSTQLAEAMASGTSVEIPLSTVLANVSGTPLEEVIVQHGTSSPDALSLSEVESAQEETEKLITEESARIKSEAEDQDAWQTSVDTIKETIANDIVATGRMSKDAARAVAELAGDFMAVQAHREGVTPEAFFAANRLNWAGPAGMSGEALNQSQTSTPEFRAWFGESKVVDESGAPLVVYHGTVGDFTEFDPKRAGEQKYSDWGEGIYLTPSRYSADYYRSEAAKNTDAAANEAYARLEALERQAVWRDGSPTYPPGTDAALAEFRRQRERAGNEAGSVMPVYVSLKNPLVIGYQSTPDPNAAREAKERGHDGIIVLTPSGAIDEIVAFRSEQIKSATGNRGTFDPSDPNILHAGGENGSPLAGYDISRLLISLTEGSNLTSPIHELGHFFLDTLTRLSNNGSERAKEDLAVFLKIATVRPEQWEAWHQEYQANDKIPDGMRAAHEAFAEGFEGYIFTGKAPSVEQQSLFRRFRAWFLQVHKSLQQFLGKDNLAKNPEFVAVVNRMLATDDQIRQAEERAGLVPDEEATNAAIEKLQAKSLRDLKWAQEFHGKTLRKLQKGVSAARKAVYTEAKALIADTPVERARAALRAMRKDANSVDPAQMAALMDSLGATSEEQLKQILDTAPSAKDATRQLAERIMLERHGEMVDPADIIRAADEAVHNEYRARAIARELTAQDEALGARADTGRRTVRGAKITENVMIEAAREFASRLAYKVPLGELKKKTQLYLAAERKSARDWRKATAAGDTAGAIKARKDQLINHLVAKALMGAQEDVQAAKEEFKTYVKGGMKSTVSKGRDPAIVSLIRVVMGEYGIVEKPAEKAADYLKMLESYDPISAGRVLPILAQAQQNAKPFNDLLPDDLTALRDLLGSLWEIAKSSRTIEIDGKKMAIEDAERILVDRLKQVGIPDTIPGEAGAITAGEERSLMLKGAVAALTRVEQWAQAMDGKWGGGFTRLLVQTIKESADKYRASSADYLKRYGELVKALEPHIKGGPIAAPELNYTFGAGKDSGHVELLHALLHSGNESNKRKLLLGRKWADRLSDGRINTARWDVFLERMHDEGVITKAHWDFVQAVWDLLEETKPLAQETHRNVFGRYFDEVTASPVKTPFGTLRGGYVPAQVDARLVSDAAIRALVNEQNEAMIDSFPQTSKGFTKGRVEYNRPLLLDLRSLSQHIDKVLLFAHMESAVLDTKKLLTRNDLKNALHRVSPKAYDAMLLPWLNRAARQVVDTPIAGHPQLTRAIKVLRSRVGMAMIGGSMVNALQQVTGISNVISKIGVGPVRRATAKYIAHPVQINALAKEKSIYVANRMSSEITAINGEMEKILINANVYQRANEWSKRHAYFMQAFADSVLVPIAWTAAYDKASADGLEEKEAIRYADHIVRTTQGSTLPEDISAFESGNVVMRLFNQFASYFNMMANTNAADLVNLAEQDLGLPKKAGKALMIGLFGLMLPIWIAEAITVAGRGGPDDDEDDGYLDDWLSSVFGIGTAKGLFAMVPVVGQAVMAASGAWTGNPTDDRVKLSPVVSIIEGGARFPYAVYDAIMDDGSWRQVVKSGASLAPLFTALPLYPIARPVGYAAGVAEGSIEPTGPVDAARGLITGTPSPESKRIH